jgi:hypothetical protein
MSDEYEDEFQRIHHRIELVKARLAAIEKQDKRPVETLEDRFAMAALKGILAHGHSWHDNESLSAEIYKIARACMAERIKK